MNYHFQESLVEVLKEIKLEIRTMNNTLQALSSSTRQLPENFDELIRKVEQISDSLQDRTLRD